MLIVTTIRLKQLSTFATSVFKLHGSFQISVNRPMRIHASVISVQLRADEELLESAAGNTTHLYQTVAASEPTI